MKQNKPQRPKVVNKTQLLQQTENLPSAGASAPLRQRASTLLGGHSRKGEETFHIVRLKAISAISGSHWPIQSVMSFPPTSISMFQHLAGMFRSWLPFPHNPGRGKALEQCFWQAAAGRQQADPSTPSSCQHTPSLQRRDHFQATPRRRQPQGSKRCPPVPQGFGHAVWPRTG